MSPKVTIVLLNLNQEEHTRECIRSLAGVLYDNLEIILVDCGSTDGSGHRLHELFPLVTYQRSEENLGFTGGNNLGMGIALAHQAEYVMLLNNDTVVEQNFIQPLVDFAESEPRLGAQCGKIYLFSDKEKFWYAGGTIEVDKAYASHRGISQKDVGQYDTIEDTGFASGCMLFMPRRVIEQIGMLDLEFFVYFEDSDWCLRARSRGYRIIYNPGSRIWHKVSVTNKIDSPQYLYLTMRNKIIFLRRHSAPSRWLKHLPYFLFFYSRHLIRMSLKWHSLKGTLAVVYGIVDGVRNHTGPGGKGRLDKLLRQ